mmetsp:Transcript_24310/g.54098  ORF Transcript_24310/g.54098 Transcript_24310/m.54098 type:complete len:867 (+) Transcript_24310:76-2676(+)
MSRFSSTLYLLGFCVVLDLASGAVHHQQRSTRCGGQGQAPCFLRASQDVGKAWSPRSPTLGAGSQTKLTSVNGSAWESIPDVPLRRQQMYFRPVSITLYCVMVLAMQSFLVFTALSVSHNTDELAGLLQASLPTDTLIAATRSSLYPSMLTMLFVCCRMYVLASTGGLGEPQLWVKVCEIVATVGMTLQFLLVLLMPFSTIRSVQNFSALAGDHTDVHPMIHTHKYQHKYQESIVWFCQILALVLIYGGALGVLIGIVTFPVQVHSVSPAIGCTCALSVLYFGVFLTQWLARTHLEYSEDDDEVPVQSRALVAATAMTIAVQKAPMLAVLFLASRMRALQLSPPTGMPPAWAQVAYILATMTTFMEALSAAYIGAARGPEQGKQSTSTPLALTQPASVTAQIFKHICTGLTYLCLVPIVVAIYAMERADGGEAPISMTMQCVLRLVSVFFMVHAGQWALQIAKDFFGKAYLVAEETLRNAGVAVHFTPSLCILFVACRMRALQISEQRGSPQGWAQDCMVMCVSATIVQVLCWVLLPLFTHSAAELAEDGNATYDLRPMVGAYAVTVVKYIALFMLHGGVIVICTSIMVITPETAKRGEYQFDARKVQEMLAFGLFVSLASMLLSSAKVVGLAIKLGIESVDPSILGTRIRLSKAALGICDGFVHLGGLVVENPEGQEWKSQYMLRVERALVQVNLRRLIWTLGREFEIKHTILEGVHVNVEKHIKHKSNVAIIMEHLNKGSAGAPQPPKKEEKKAEAKPAPSATKAEGGFAPTVIVREVRINDVGAAAIFGQAPLHLDLADINYWDFDEQEGGSKSLVVADVVAILLKTILKSVLNSSVVIGKGMAHAVGGVMSSAARKMGLSRG